MRSVDHYKRDEFKHELQIAPCRHRENIFLITAYIISCVYVYLLTLLIKFDQFHSVDKEIKCVSFKNAKLK